jgi:AraC family transcriptional regulator
LPSPGEWFKLAATGISLRLLPHHLLVGGQVQLSVRRVATMSHLASMHRAIEFIEADLKEEIKVADMAEAVTYSLYHFCRIFNQVVHHSPYDYLMRRRLSESARELLETDKKITDIAFEYQFNSPETYSRAFKRMFDMQPSQWKKQGRLDGRFLMSRLSLAYLQHMDRGDCLRPTVAEREAVHLAGVVTLVEGDLHNTVPHLWQILNRELEIIGRLKGSEGYYGLVWYPKSSDGSQFFYMAAVEVESLDRVDSALVMKTLPPLKCARFIHKGSVEDRQFTLDYIYQTWLPRSDRQLAYPFEIDYYGQHTTHFDQEKAEWAIYIPIE